MEPSRGQGQEEGLRGHEDERIAAILERIQAIKPEYKQRCVFNSHHQHSSPSQVPDVNWCSQSLTPTFQGGGVATRGTPRWQQRSSERGSRGATEQAATNPEQRSKHFEIYMIVERICWGNVVLENEKKGYWRISQHFFCPLLICRLFPSTFWKTLCSQI